MATRELLGPDDSILRLDRFDDADQALKDRILERLQSNSEADHETGCVIYNGFWEDNGQAKIRVGGRVRNLARVAAWIFLAGFRIHGPERAVRKCGTPACWNYEHLKVALDQSEAIRIQRSKGRLGDVSRHRLSREKAEQLREFVAQGGTLEEAARKFGIGVHASRAVILGRTWPRKEGGDEAKQ